MYIFFESVIKMASYVKLTKEEQSVSTISFFLLCNLSSGKVHYSIYDGNNDRKFQVNSSSGVVMLMSPLDYESAPLRTLTIRASDSDPEGHAQYTDFYLHVHVDDVNDNAPEFADSLVTVSVPETLSVGKERMACMLTLDDNHNTLNTYEDCRI